jgi:hypothetical protein
MKKYLTYILILFLLNSCFVVYHKENVLNLNERGDKLQSLKMKGYYYLEFEKNTYPYFKNHYGGFSQDSSKPYHQKIIKPIILNKNGTVRTFSYQSGLQENLIFDYGQNCRLNDVNSIQSAKEHFECVLNNDNDKFTVWGKGVFRTDNSGVVIQYYINWIGDYYLQEKKGQILNDSTFVLTELFDYKLNKSDTINELYKFQRFDNKPDSTNFITKHPKKFRKKTRFSKVFN